MRLRKGRFSPVAGIQWVETDEEKSVSENGSSFSPVAGIQWVETAQKAAAADLLTAFQSRCRDSVG